MRLGFIFEIRLLSFQIMVTGFISIIQIQSFLGKWMKITKGILLKDETIYKLWGKTRRVLVNTITGENLRKEIFTTWWEQHT